MGGWRVTCAACFVGDGGGGGAKGRRVHGNQRLSFLSNLLYRDSKKKNLLCRILEKLSTWHIFFCIRRERQIDLGLPPHQKIGPSITSLVNDEASAALLAAIIAKSSAPQVRCAGQVSSHRWCSGSIESCGLLLSPSPLAGLELMKQIFFFFAKNL